ncbi:MAG: enoyl-CoA hydratase-related protein [Desulfobacterales bacterium]
MSQNNDPLIYREEDEIAFIEINRPEKKNALNFECWQLFDSYCDRLIFTARKILPEEAKALGLVSHILPEENFASHVTEYVKSITANAPKALEVVKEICDATFTMEEAEALEFERQRAAENILSGQCIEGISAFLEKRAPQWRS